MKKICIFGKGGFSKEVLWLIELLGYEVDSFIDIQDSENWCGFPVKNQKYFDVKNHKAVIAIGSPKTREKIVNQLPRETEFPNLIHPTAQIGRTVKLGIGNIICSNCILTSDIFLKNHCQLNLSTTIGHDCIIDDYFTTAPGVHVSGNCKFNERVYFGTNSCSIEEINICSDVIIGAGAVVNKHILEAGIYIGLPARKLEKK